MSARARPSLLALRAWVLGVCIGSGCAPPPSSLTVQLQTDLAPGREFDALSLTVAGDGMLERTFPVGVDASRSYGRAVRLADVDGLVDGTYRVTLTLLLDGAVVQRQPRRASVRGASVVTLLVTRDCGGVVCPGTGDPAAEACLGGACVDPGCGEPGAAPCAVVCVEDSDCTPSAIACVTTRCALGICFSESDDTRCSDGEVCDTALGCGGHTLPAPSLRVPASGTSTGSAFDDDPAHAHAARYLLIRWLPVPGAVSYEVEIDDSCDVGSYETCSFPSPEHQERTAAVVTRPGPLPVALTAPVGTRYYLRVRACADAVGVASCGAYSTVRYVDVGRQRTDLDGDGYADLGVGTPDLPPTGSAYVYLGGPTGARTTPDHTFDGRTSRFGFEMVAGDFDGDGHHGLVVTAHDTAFHGIVYVLSGFQATPVVRHVVESPIAPADQSFGLALAAGDLDADGYDDLAVGAPRVPGSTARQGMVFVYRGAPTETWATPSQMLTVDDPEHGGFGRSLAIGDLDGDGVVDLVVGAPDEPGTSRQGRGIVHVFRGRPRGLLDAAPSWSFEEPTGASDAIFGSALATGDLSGDGIADLVIGSPQERVGPAFEGAAYRVDGGSAGPGALIRIANPDADTAFFGTSLAIVRAAGADDRALLAVGGPRHLSGAGAVHLFYGDSLVGSPLNSTPDGQLGWAVGATGDVDGDGWDELAMSAPMGAGAGEVFVRLGDVAASGTSTATLPAPSAAPGARFGWSLAH